MALGKPILMGELSGRVGGVVFSHNAGGAYVRAGSIPTNPNTTFQQAVRNAVAQLSAMWSNTLTRAQQDAWNVYGANVKVTNRIGDQINISGLAHYVRSNTARLQAGVDRVDDGPTKFSLPPFGAPSYGGFSEAAQTGNVTYTTGSVTDPWANEVGGFMFIYVSRPQNAGINYFRGPYRFIVTLVGDPAPPVVPAIIPTPFSFVAEQRLFFRVAVGEADGRYSVSAFNTTVAVV